VVILSFLTVLWTFRSFGSLNDLRGNRNKRLECAVDFCFCSSILRGRRGNVQVGKGLPIPVPGNMIFPGTGWRQGDQSSEEGTQSL
jgi:hypothetical protein